jgi:amino acid transporter
MSAGVLPAAWWIYPTMGIFMSELRKDSLSFFEALGQSVANVSPTLTPALAVAVVAGIAGTASWLVYVIATTALLIVALNIGKLAGRIPAAGSFFIYVSRSLGPSYGMLAGWAMLAAYIFTAMALTIATSLFVKTFFLSLGITLAIPNFIMYLIVSVLIWAFATRDIRISARIGLTMEAVSVLIILAVIVITLAHYGFQPDMKQITLQGASIGSVGQAIVFGIFSYVGFESSASLGKETRNPKTTIPKAITWTAISSGIFFVVTTYVITQGFGDNATNLGGSAAPLGDITNRIGKWMTAPVYFGATISSFACALASLNAFGRMLFSLGRYQFVHSSMGIVHDKRKTPFFALSVGAVINFIVCAIFAGQPETNTFGWYGTLASYGFIIVYFMCSVAAPVLLKHTGELKPGNVVIGALGAVLMFLSLVGSVYPVPAAPYNYFPYGFAVYMLAGFVWYSVVKLRSPQVLAGIAHDLETAAGAAE